jgi:hypothetical protein
MTSARVGGIAQVAFIVRDLDASVARFAEDLDVGPWLVVKHLAPQHAHVRGEPATLDLSVALAYSGSVMIELIQEHSDVGLPRIGARDPSDCAFHHVARTSTDFATDHARLSQGRTVVFEASLPAELGAGRFAYFDNPGPLPGCLELVELTPELEALFASVQGAADRWDRQTAVIDAAALPGAR